MTARLKLRHEDGEQWWGRPDPVDGWLLCWNAANYDSIHPGVNGG